MDEDRAGDVTRFWGTVLTPIARDVKSAVIVIDHDVKTTVTSRYARGSGAKLASVDVAYKIDAPQPFSRTQAGTLKLVCSKDRRGWLGRHYRIRVTPGPVLGFEIEATQGGLPMDASPILQAVYAVLAVQPQTASRLAGLVAKRSGRDEPRRETMSRALNELLDLRLADKIDMGSFQNALWSLPQPT
jgi:hypothetical protein